MSSWVELKTTHLPGRVIATGTVPSGDEGTRQLIDTCLGTHKGRCAYVVRNSKNEVSYMTTISGPLTSDTRDDVKNNDAGWDTYVPTKGLVNASDCGTSKLFSTSLKSPAFVEIPGVGMACADVTYTPDLLKANCELKSTDTECADSCLKRPGGCHMASYWGETKPKGICCYSKLDVVGGTNPGVKACDAATPWGEYKSTRKTFILRSDDAKSEVLLQNTKPNKPNTNKPPPPPTTTPVDHNSSFDDRFWIVVAIIGCAFLMLMSSTCVMLLL